MKKGRYLFILSMLLGAVFISGLGCKSIFGSNNKTPPAPTTGDTVFDNDTGQRLRAYIDGIFMDFVEIDQERRFENNPVGLHELKADNFSSGVWGPIQIDLRAGSTFTWTLR